MAHYENVTNGCLANMMDSELRRHSIDDGIYRTKRFEVIRRLRTSPSNKSINEVKLLRGQLSTANKKLEKIRAVVK